MNTISGNKQENELMSGDVFLIPLDNGSFSIGMFHKNVQKPLYSAICSFYSAAVSNADEISETMLSNPICIALVVTNSLETKKWQVVANFSPKIESNALPDYKYRQTFFRKQRPIMDKVYGDGNIRKFLRAYHGLVPWNSMHDPKYFDKMLLDQKLRPSSIKFA